MPIKVTLVSPRSRMAVKTKSTVSVTSEFEYLPLRSPRNTKNAEVSPRQEATGQVSRVKQAINNFRDMSKHDKTAKETENHLQHKLVPPLRASELSAPARPPKYPQNNLISDSEKRRSSAGSVCLDKVSEKVFLTGMRTSTPSPKKNLFGDQMNSQNQFSTGMKDSKLDRFDKFSSELKIQETAPCNEPRHFQQYSFQKAAPQPQQLNTFISLRDLPSQPIAEFLMRSRSPSPPPPPSGISDGNSGPISLKEDMEFPPPPSYNTLKRLSTYRRSDRESRRERLERMAVKEEQERLNAIEMNKQEERLNQTVTCAETSSPCREAAKGAAGWQKFLGRSTGRSVSVHLTKEEAAYIRERRQRTIDPACDQMDVEEETAPPLPPKPKQKISVMGSPNTDQFIVMDNSALFTKQKQEASVAKTEKQGERLDCHSRSDSGLSSLSSWTNVTGSKSGSSSVRSSSIVSDCSSKIEELLEDQNKNTTFLSMCSLKLENLIEQDELNEKRETIVTDESSFEESNTSKDNSHELLNSNTKDHAVDEPLKNVDDYDYDDVCQSSTVSGVQRQLETIKHQKEMLIKDIVQNEELGMSVTHKLEEVMSSREKDKYNTFIGELEKVILLMLSINVRLQKAEEELACGNLTDWEKESRRYKRDKLVKQLNEADNLKRMSDRRMKNVENIIEKHLTGDDLAAFKTYIEKKEELLTAQRACEDSEKNILH
eukprot:GFUD01030983.1.p1 GENE.GFUD01030983.1~~GFUD01030983.1.p1  ORF type:complete len:714 (-),score=140.02 GFUD01030983.1:82-2223(-)